MGPITQPDLYRMARAVVDELHPGGTCDPRSSGHQSALCKLRRYVDSLRRLQEGYGTFMHRHHSFVDHTQADHDHGMCSDHAHWAGGSHEPGTDAEEADPRNDPFYSEVV